VRTPYLSRCQHHTAGRPIVRKEVKRQGGVLLFAALVAVLVGLGALVEAARGEGGQGER
jgi:hypothetical protein